LLAHCIIHPPPVICDRVRHLGRIVPSVLGAVVICDGPAFVGPAPRRMYRLGCKVICKVNGSTIVGRGLGILATIKSFKAFNSNE